MQSKNEADAGAFFDFDNTLITGDSARIGIDFLWKEGYVSFPLIMRILVCHQLFTREWISIERMTSLVLTIYRGKKLQSFVDGAGDFYLNFLRPHLSAVMLDRLAWHRQEGHKLILLSASIRYMLEEVVRNLGFDHLESTDLEQDENGLLTGRSKGPVLLGEHKAHAARAIADKEGIDLDKSWAYGDHHTDIPILSLVGHPTAVNPDWRLEKFAGEHNWPIIHHGR